MFLLVVAYGGYLGFVEGIIKTVFSVVSLLMGLIFAFKFTPAMTKFLEVGFKVNNPLMFGLSFILTFLAAMYSVRFIASALTEMLEIANSNMINRVLGGGLLILVFTLMYSMVVWFGNMSGIINPQSKEESKTYTMLEAMPAKAYEWASVLRPMISEFWEASNNMVNQMDRKATQKVEQEPTIYNIPNEAQQQQPPVYEDNNQQNEQKRNNNYQEPSVY